MEYNQNGLIVYDGPSKLTGEPIVAIVTGLNRKSSNPKTRDMLQLWILPRDVSPVEAHYGGNDRLICGDCPIKRGCYVEWKNVPQKVWHAFQAGRYRHYDKSADRHLFSGRKIRLGACGDPAAVPYRLCKHLVSLCVGHTGYTHQWRKRRFWRFSRLVMASCESWPDACKASLQGWRTFRVAPKGGRPFKPHEVSCPASEEMGHRTTCERCTLCAGTTSNGRSVVIVAHGSKAKLSALLPVIQ